MPNFCLLVEELSVIGVSDEYVGKVIARSSLVNRRDNMSLFRDSMDSHLSKLYQNKEKERLRKGIAKLIGLLREDRFDPGMADHFVDDELPGMVLDRPFRGITYVCDAVDTFYHDLKNPSEGFPLMAEVFRSSVGGLDIKDYDRNKRDLSALEYQAFVAGLRQTVKSKYKLF